MNPLIKIFISLVITAVIILGISIPTVHGAQGFFQFPFIPGLEEKARNIFFHVPMAWTSVLAFFMALYYGIQYLRTKNQDYDLRSVSSAGLGLMFCILATVTGSIWAKFNWGSFWNWDPRETSIFILLLIYGAYFVLRSAVEDDEKRATLSSVYSIMAGVTVPFFIFVMPRIMSGLHPGSLGDEQGKGPVLELKMSPNMLAIFFVSLIGFTMLYYWMYSLRIRTARVEKQLQTIE
ncbi:MAG: cytochrome c biogenesis protein CcsA [Ignavibacteriales bacterium]|nr:cytochrome c biogenesis protein CcsA [Ignavibacteriales bacterium]